MKRRNIDNFYKLNKIMKERMNYIENGDSEDNLIWFGVVDEFDKKIVDLINQKGE
tara:strand:+ start:221 stop:385 length:165 start_codon:yes stop_codon:yes gene_type:complete